MQTHLALHVHNVLTATAHPSPKFVPTTARESANICGKLSQPYLLLITKRTFSKRQRALVDLLPFFWIALQYSPVITTRSSPTSSPVSIAYVSRLLLTRDGSPKRPPVQHQRSPLTCLCCPRVSKTVLLRVSYAQIRWHTCTRCMQALCRTRRALLIAIEPRQ